MALNLQGNEITKVTFEGTELDSLTLEGVEVFSKDSGPSFTLTFNPIGSPAVRYQSAVTSGTPIVKASDGSEHNFSSLIVYNSNEILFRLVSPVAVTTNFSITLVQTGITINTTITAGNTNPSSRIPYPNSFNLVAAIPVNDVIDNNK